MSDAEGLDWGDRGVQLLKGTGPKRALLLGKLGITSIADLLLHRPNAYLDRRSVIPLAALESGTIATVMARLLRIDLRRQRGGGRLVVARLADDSGTVEAIWFNQPYLARTLRPGAHLLLSGPVRRWRGLQLSNPEFEILAGAPGDRPLTGKRIVPVYALTAGLSQKVLRSLIHAALDQIPAGVPDPIPEALRARLSLPRINEAWRALHFPETMEEAQVARRRFAFEEFLLFQLLLLHLRARKRQSGRARPIRPDQGRLHEIRAALPFRLTSAQERAITEILADLAGERPARRLLQGDVGSGKTVVAAIACACAAASGSQACFLAPTEVLATQHSGTLRALIEPAGIEVAQLIGGTPPAERRAILERLKEGRVDVMVGTHAILEPDVRFRDLGLVIVDEQQRFGVEQRVRMMEKGSDPHTLVMTATPIPRTLALTLYGDLDITTIDSLPPGRTPVRTRLVGRERWDDLLGFIAGRLRGGEQAFFVYPLVEESASLDLRDATRMHREIAGHPAFGGLDVGLLHGRVPPEERARVLDALHRGQMQAVVATTVIEVGLDLPRASVMVVEHPKRFGLAQLHQLRGRIGRAPGQVPYFFLIRPEGGIGGTERLRVLLNESNGFRIAEQDLRLRGPGQLLGLRQAGLSRIGVADLVHDRDLLLDAHRAADEILRSDPAFPSTIHQALWREALRRHPDAARLFQAG